MLEFCDELQDLKRKLKPLYSALHQIAIFHKIGKKNMIIFLYYNGSWHKLLNFAENISRKHILIIMLNFS